ncbi:MAG: YjbH domain-containing protein [bacterium]
MEKLQIALTAQGFENVAVVVAERKIFVTYENRIYRHEARAIAEALRTAPPFAKGATHLILILQYRKLPFITVTVPLQPNFSDSSVASRAYGNSAAEVFLEVEPGWHRLRSQCRTNTSLRKLDIVLFPQLHAMFGEYEDPWKFQANLAPELAITLWKGMSLSAQLIVPLYNELGPEGDSVRPGVLAFSQLLRLPQQVFAAVTLGHFTRQRYGVDLEITKFVMNGKLALGGNLGYTGYASYDQGKWIYSSLDFWTALADVRYRWRCFDLYAGVTYGKFLYGDVGWRMDVLRQFGEVDIGFYGIQTQTGANLGFNFSIPIFPPRYLKPGALRVRTAKYFAWEYRYWSIWKSGSTGFRYETGQGLADLMKSFNPDFIASEVFHQRQ